MYRNKSDLASSLVLYFLLPYTHSVFMVPKKLSIGALSQQFPFLLIDPMIPPAQSLFWYSQLVYWLPLSECKGAKTRRQASGGSHREGQTRPAYRRRCGISGFDFAFPSTHGPPSGLLHTNAQNQALTPKVYCSWFPPAKDPRDFVCALPLRCARGTSSVVQSIGFGFDFSHILFLYCSWFSPAKEPRDFVCAQPLRCARGTSSVVQSFSFGFGFSHVLFLYCSWFSLCSLCPLWCKVLVFHTQRS